jgi:P-type conjugative transfer protein TrbJ
MHICAKKILLGAVGALVLLASSSAQVARAQFAVIDPANLIENIISAVQNLAAVANQATQLEHEVQSLANEAQNLRQFPSSLSSGVLGQYLTQYASLVSTMQGIDGIARNLATLTAQYNTLFPNTALSNGPLSYLNVMTQLTGWLGQTRGVYQGAYQTQAQVMSTLAADSGNVAQLLQQSGKSSGALDAIQAGNLLTGQVASQLMKLNQQMAATDQAQMNWIAQQTQLLAEAQKTQQNQLAGYTTPGTPVVNASLDSLH